MAGRNINTLQSTSGASSTETVTTFPGSGRVLGGSSQATCNAAKVKLTKEHFDAAIAYIDVNGLTRLFGVLRGLSHARIAHLIVPMAGRNIIQETKDVLIYWIKKKAGKRQDIIDGLEKSVLNNAKENLKTHWKDCLNQTCVPEDSDTIIMVGELVWNELYLMFTNIGLKEFEIQMHAAQTTNVVMNAGAVFKDWAHQDPAPTVRELVDNLKSVDNLDAAQVLGVKWGIPLEDI